MAEPHLPNIDVSVADDRRHATLRIGAETIVADARSLQNVIERLGAARSEMLPQVENHSPHDGQFLQIGGPVLEVVDAHDGSVVRIAFRTPQYGWIGFQFQPAQAAEVGRYLVSYENREPRMRKDGN